MADNTNFGYIANSSSLYRLEADVEEQEKRIAYLEMRLRDELLFIYKYLNEIKQETK